jgi:hypothetical protein
MDGVIRQVEDIHPEGRGITLYMGGNVDMMEGVRELEHALDRFWEVLS